MDRTGAARRVVAALATVAALVSGAGCGTGDDGGGRAAARQSDPPAASPAASASSASAPASSAPAAGTPAGAAVPAPSAALTAHVQRLPGRLGLVVRDRTTGAVWRAGDPAHTAWTASTIKVAIAVHLLERQRAGALTLTAHDRTKLRAMLVESSNEATDVLWSRHGAEATIERFRAGYGMAGLAVVPGYRPYWRHLQCTAEDLAALLSYALDRLSGPDRAYLVEQLRAAGAAHQWGVWAAGPAQQPGHKPGWAFKPEGRPDHWVTHSVGFAGAGERYVLAVTYDLPPGAGVRGGVQAVSDVVALAFGRPVPTPARGPS